MRCENKFCVYYLEGKCINREEISLDQMGMCKEFIQVEIEDDELDVKRNKIIDKLARHLRYQKDAESKQMKRLMASIKAKQKQNN